MNCENCVNFRPINISDKIEKSLSKYCSGKRIATDLYLGETEFELFKEYCNSKIISKTQNTDWDGEIIWLGIRVHRINKQSHIGFGQEIEL